MTAAGNRRKVSSMTSSPARRRILTAALIGAVLALAAACGSSSSSSTTTGGGGGASSTGGGASTPSISSGGSVSDSMFCALAKKWSKQEPKQVAVLTKLSSGPAAIKTFYTTLGKDYSSLISVAPGDIKPSLVVLYGVYQKLVGILAKNNWSIIKAGPQIQAQGGLLDGPKVKAAIAQVDAWGKAHSCHM